MHDVFAESLEDFIGEYVKTTSTFGLLLSYLCNDASV